MDLLITDVTEMHQGNYCVAGWDSIRRCMARPLPGRGNWTARLLNAHTIEPGNTIRFFETNGYLNSTYPHRTEDTPIDPSRGVTLSLGPSPWLGANSPPCFETLDGAFAGNIQTTGEWNGARKGAYAMEGVRTASLSAVAVDAKNLKFFEDSYKGTAKLRAYLSDRDACYNLPVVAKSLREQYRMHGVAHLNEQLPGVGYLHVRVGLARAWSGQPDKCSVMINGVYW